MEASLPRELVRGQIAQRDFRKAQWQLALNQVLDTDDLSATIHAIQLVPREGRLSLGAAEERDQAHRVGISTSNPLSFEQKANPTLPTGISIWDGAPLLGDLPKLKNKFGDSIRWGRLGAP